MALSTEQLLLLNNLMYMDGNGTAGNPLLKSGMYEGQTIGEWLNSIQVSSLDDNAQYGSFMTGQDWKNIINSVKQDETLMNMTIATTHVDKGDGGGGGYSALFVDSNSHEAVVAFRGTAAGEWKDNFIGGNAIDTAQQRNALEWYQDVYNAYGLDNYEVTVTGHSKGGNKSKYITLLDDTVDHCVSFDGQGFSDKFFVEYGDEIAKNQGKIENHNVDYDYVNILLNDVGETKYYTGQDLGEGGFLENHCPNSFMKYDQNGNFTIEISPDGQGKEMQAVDAFFNNCLRSMPDDDRTEMLEMINCFIDDAFQIDGKSGQEIADIFMETITNPKYSDDLAYLLAYTIKYEQTNPEFAEQIRSVLSNFGMDDFVKYVDIIDAILNFEFDGDYGPFGVAHIHLDFDTLLGIINGTINFAEGGLDFLAKYIPGFSWDSTWALEQICKWIEEKCGIKLSPEELRELLGIVEMVSDDLKHIEINDNGADLRIASKNTSIDSGVGACRFSCNISKLKKDSENLAGIQSTLCQTSGNIEAVANSIALSLNSSSQIKRSILAVKKKIEVNADSSRELEMVLMAIAGTYESTESKICGDVLAG